MKRAEVIRILRERRTELNEVFGVKSLALFGLHLRFYTTAPGEVR